MLYLLVGTSCSGKTTFANAYFDKSQACVSTTTRPKRPGEVNGEDYHFITQEHFDICHQQGFFIVETNYAGYSYGLTNHSLRKALDQGDAYAIVDYSGYQTMSRHAQKFYIPYTVLWFKTPLSVCQERLLERHLNETDYQHRIEQMKTDIERNDQLANEENILILDGSQPLDELINQVKTHRGKQILRHPSNE